MRYKRSILQLVSILLIILLTQKMIGGLYLHNWLHSSRSSSHHPPQEKIISQYNCSCIDDFNIPFSEPAVVLLEAPPAAHFVFFTATEISLPVVSKFFHSLRGPPVS